MHTLERYIFSGKGIYIFEVSSLHTWSLAQNHISRIGCPRGLQGNWITKKAKGYPSAFN